ncbi:MAG: hypothetical protein U5K36_09310 [Roseovarius sp.]|nr:hypothetical protein [Roseovarius sp.]
MRNALLRARQETLRCARDHIGNLAENAVQAARAQVRLMVRQSGASLTILVEDDGPGLADQDITFNMLY